jgi:hypothetical protein
MDARSRGLVMQASDLILLNQAEKSFAVQNSPIWGAQIAMLFGNGRRYMPATFRAATLKGIVP